MTTLNYRLSKLEQNKNNEKKLVITPVEQKSKEISTLSERVFSHQFRNAVNNLVTQISIEMLSQEHENLGLLGTLCCTVYQEKDTDCSMFHPRMIKNVKITFYPEKVLRLTLTKSKNALIDNYSLVVNPIHIKKERKVFSKIV